MSGERPAAFDLSAFAGRFWACEPTAARDYRAQLDGVLSGRIQPVAAGAASQRAARPAQQGKVAVIPIRGCLTDHGSWISDILAWDSYDGIGGACDQAAKDPDIAAVVLDINSGGGNVLGLQECADRIWALAQAKPTVGFVNAYCCSAAYFCASQANLLLMMASGQVGSIGVLLMHESFAGFNAQLGVEVTYLVSSAAQKKAEGNPDFPLGDDAKAYQLKQLNQYHAAFAGAVARGRRTGIADVERNYGQGRTMGAEDALRVGAICGKETTLLNVIARAARGEGASKGTRAAALAAPVSTLSTQGLLNEKALLDMERSDGNRSTAVLRRWIDVEQELDGRRSREREARLAASPGRTLTPAEARARINALK
jgi:ClpP class serine protease